MFSNRKLSLRYNIDDDDKGDNTNNNNKRHEN